MLGAIAGGLLGSAVAGRRDQGLGVVLGAGAGALAGNSISRSNNRCR
ncbi:glycine zipper 2TM domain-containing protein [Sphingomonas immobilis]